MNAPTDAEAKKDATLGGEGDFSGAFPRLASVIKFQNYLVIHGKITLPILTVILFVLGYFELLDLPVFRMLGGWVTLFGLAGISVYWFIYVKNKDKIESIEKAIRDGTLTEDISNYMTLSLKFGSPFWFLLVVSSLFAIFWVISVMIAIAVLKAIFTK